MLIRRDIHGFLLILEPEKGEKEKIFVLDLRNIYNIIHFLLMFEKNLKIPKKRKEMGNRLVKI